MRSFLSVALLFFVCSYSTNAQNIRINEIVSSNASLTSDEDGDSSDWIELYNAGQSGADLSGYGLSDDNDNPFKWVIPEISLAAGEYLLIWASGKDRTIDNGTLHTNFSISAGGEEILLTRPDGEKVDEIPPTQIPTDKSYGRTPDGATNFTFYSHPTPGTANSTTGYETILNNPTFSHEAGFYSSPFSLSISSSDPEAKIIYTLDGSDPDPENTAGTTYQYKNQYPQQPGSSSGQLLSASFESAEYAGPLSIAGRSGEEDQLTHISSTYHSSPSYFPNKPVFKGRVVKAQVIKQGALPSEVITKTYFVDPAKHYTLPLISISIQEDLLFDYEKGIYVAGKDFDDWRSSNQHAEANGGTKANYGRRGEESEYPAHIEVFEGLQGRVLSQDIGLRLHGGWSREHPAKTLRLYARNEYGNTHMEHDFFPERTHSAYKRLILRNSGNDWGTTMFRDAAMQEIMSHLSFDTQASRPAVLFINGEYWGLHNIRERYDKYFFESTYQVDPENIDLFTGNLEMDQGDSHHYQETMDYIRQNGLRDEEHYNYIKTRIDVENFMDYQLAQIFLGNTDWPGNNIKAWRTRTDGYKPDAPQGQDGRWRWLMYDTDFGFGLYNSNGYREDVLSFATEPNGPGWPNPPWSTFLLRKLLENEQFRNDFINRFSDQLNSALRPEVMKAKINSLKQIIEPEMAEHIQRWKSPGSLNSWHDKVNVMLNFADKRPAYQRTHLRNYFELGSDYQLQVDVPHPNRGYIKVNSLELRAGTEGLPDKIYPWSGQYFQGTSLMLEAVAAPGYVFAGWEGSSTASSEKLLLEPEGDLALTAVFERQQDVPQLIHYWNFNARDNLQEASYTLREGSLDIPIAEDGESEISSSTGNGFSGLNARFDEEAGSHLRINNPLGSQLVYALPTTGYSNISFQYETRRSGQGAGMQVVEYSTDGSSFTEIEKIRVQDEDPVLHTIDFSAITQVNNNPDFKIRITFEEGEGSTAGNNRFDNVTLSGLPEEGTNLPPQVISAVELQNFIEQEVAREINISQVFEDPQGEVFNLSFAIDNPGILDASLSEEKLILKPLKRGEALVTLSADDGVNPPISTSFRVMVYPEAFSLAEANFNFSAWDADQPEMSFPEHMLFLQSDLDDPSADDPLPYAYFIPHHDYHEDEADHIGFPYRNTSRSRLNGLGEEGISMINTGRGRDLGGVLLALDTRGIEGFSASWLAATILENERRYGLRLQYRYSVEEPFKDMVVNGNLPEYIAEGDGHTAVTESFSLPSEMMDKEYIQLLWRYHHISGGSGPRTEIRLDDITVAENPGTPYFKSPAPGSKIADDVTFEWNSIDKAGAYHLQLAQDESFEEIIFEEDDISGNSLTVSSTDFSSQNYARIRAKNSIAYGRWSESLQFASLINGIDDGSKTGISMKSFPNPFTNETNLKVTLEQQSQFRITLHDLSGKIQAEIANDIYSQGSHNFNINTSRLSAGIYIIIYQSDKLQLQHKLIKY